MEKLNQQYEQFPQFDILPLEFKHWFEKYKYQMPILPEKALNDSFDEWSTELTQLKFQSEWSLEIESSLLEGLKSKQITTGNSPVYPDRIRPSFKEMALWFGANEIIFPNKTHHISRSKQSVSKKMVMVYLDVLDAYELFWEVGFQNAVEESSIDIEKNEIIEDYQEMLSIFIREKNKKYELMGKPPYLGSYNNDGKLSFLENDITRPDYLKIKSSRLINFRNCVRIVLGINHIGLIPDVSQCLANIQPFEAPFDNEGILLNWKPESYLSHPRQNNVVKYRDEWKDIVCFCNEFLKKLTLEAKAGFLEIFHERNLKLSGPIQISDIGKSHYTFYFKTLPFLKWAKESGYAIPDELSFVEKEDGTLQWADNTGLGSIQGTELTAKEKQELGRLRAEKATMDLSIKAAIKVGRYIESAKLNERLIFKNEIVDLINKIELKIPQTRIDQIWRSIPEERKHGPGRPKNQ